MDTHAAELDELAQGNDLVLWLEERSRACGAYLVWCIATDTGEHDLIGTGSTPAEAIEAARQQIRAWEARKGTT